MIVARAAQVRASLATVDALQRAEDDANALQETFAELHMLHGELSGAANVRGRIADRIDADRRLGLDAEFARLVDDTRVSRLDFEQRSRQAARLRAIAKRAGDLNLALDAAWNAYANAEARRRMEPLLLVLAMPEMQARARVVHQLGNRLRELAARAPESDVELAEFDDTLQRSQDELKYIEGLTPSIIAFLRGVSSGTATLADASDEVLEWCRHGNRSRSFSVQFKSLP